MKMYRIFLIAAGFMLAQHSLLAQLNDTTRLYTEIEKLQQLYKLHALSFNIRYTYASELHPDVMLDSMKGAMELDGKNYHYLLDSTETIANSRYNIILFKEDKIMYVAKPATVVNEDPMSQLRQLTGKSGMTACTVSEKGKHKIFSIKFSAESSCREMQFIIDKTSGYLLSMRYMIKTSMLMESATVDPDPEYGEYAIVQTDFNNYKELKNGSLVYNEQDFFYKEGDVFKTTPAYSDYKVFTGSPNL